MARPLALPRPGSLFRRCATVLVASALLTTGVGLVAASDDSDNGEMHVSVLPTGNNPASPPGDPSGPAAFVPGATQPLPRSLLGMGTVTGRILATDAPGAAYPTVLTVIVRDDRGTAMGWTLVLSADSQRSGWSPSLVDNRSNTITLVEPPVDARAGLDAGVASGGILGPLLEPTRVLSAAQGGGAGVFVQHLGISGPPTPSSGPGFVYLQFTFAP